MTENKEVQAPPHVLVTYIVISSLVSVAFFLLTLWCPLNVDPDQVDSPIASIHRQAFFLMAFTMFVAGMTGGCLSNIRRIIQHTAPGPFDAVYCLSYYMRPLLGGISGIFVFFLLMGGMLTFNAGSTGSPEWMTLAGRTPFIGFGLLAGYGSKEFTNKLTDLADSLFALSKNNKGE